MTQLGPPLGSGKEAEVFAYGDLALKLYREGRGSTAVFREAANLAVVTACGLPAPAVYWWARSGGAGALP